MKFLKIRGIDSTHGVGGKFNKKTFLINLDNVTEITVTHLSNTESNLDISFGNSKVLVSGASKELLSDIEKTLNLSRKKRFWPSFTIKQLKIEFRFSWYNLWVGIYPSLYTKELYVCLLPCCVIIISKRG